MRKPIKRYIRTIPSAKKRTWKKKSKSERSNLIKQCDDIFREIIRRRDNWTCQRTGYRGKNMDVAHFFPRDNKRVRWDEDNACLLKKGIHKYWAHSKHEEFRDFWISRIGKERFERLKLRSQVRGTIYTHELKVIKIGLEIRLEGMKK